MEIDIELVYDGLIWDEMDSTYKILWDLAFIAAVFLVFLRFCVGVG